MVHSVKAGLCFVIREDQLSWDEASAACRQLHPVAHLVDMQTQEEETALMDLIPTGIF